MPNSPTSPLLSSLPPIRSSSLPDETNVAQLQEELEAGEAERAGDSSLVQRDERLCGRPQPALAAPHVPGGRGRAQKGVPKEERPERAAGQADGVRLREAQTQAELRELKLTAQQLESQKQIHSKLNKGLQAQLSEMKRKQAESDCKSKEEVMSVRLREADSMQQWRNSGRGWRSWRFRSGTCVDSPPVKAVPTVTGKKGGGALQVPPPPQLFPSLVCAEEN
ncbi:hypothetical protein SKAU_G00183870 [Synaphobranchus kaupii]|uniref:Uncharacterized protein n=1 Tax=Synaphobranchus kaupii TaxID=118154 RepID=A0A9Q1FC37_SYNKA|nr:hypothetical protein SKAU_G00183870 [Synaphobranchus kaupii]